MDKREMKKRIRDAYKRAYGTEPKGRELVVHYATKSGSLAHFDVNGINFSYQNGKVVKDARS